MRISRPPTLPAPLAIAALLTFIFTAVLALTLYLLGNRTTTTEYESLRPEGHIARENTPCCCCCYSAGIIFDPGPKSVISEPQEVDELVVASGSDSQSIHFTFQLILGLVVLSLLGLWWYRKGCEGALAESWKEDVKRKSP